MYSFFSSFRPVRTTFSALMITTWSPVSIVGV